MLSATTMLHAAVLLPSVVATVIVTLPTPAAVTTPALTVAIEASLVVQETLLSVAVAGKTVSCKVRV